jgi:hypothetical protein
VRRYRGFNRADRTAIIDELSRRDGYLCRLCLGLFDVKLADPDHPAFVTIDHIVPLGEDGEAGAPGRLDNLQLVHSLCNGLRARKGDHQATSFARELKRALVSHPRPTKRERKAAKIPIKQET